jgi:TIR domain
MAQLHILERRQLEKLFEMGGGYVLDFSNRTLEEFVADSVGAEIYDDRYYHGSGSKANRLRGFWKVESDALVGKLVRDLVEYAVGVNKNIDPDLVRACRAVADRLLAASARTNPVRPAQTVDQRPAEVPETTQPIRVFNSYSWDTEVHKDWVREFADELATNGIDIILDQYDLRIGEDRFQFMETSVREADAVLCVCTPAYVAKANSRSAGVGVETSLITPQFFERMKSAKQFIPILRHSDDTAPPTPDYLSALILVDFRDDEGFRSQMEQLLRHLHKRPKHRKPDIGGPPVFDWSI